ncbi:MAG: YraN family protein [Planctomycetota bacterium]|nr:YraN family protein [Planctomycetota bacterium]
MASLRARLGEQFPRAYFHLGFPDPGQASHLELGQMGESHVARRLRGAGWRVIARQARVPACELDLIALQGSSLVLVEVKSALWPSGQGSGPPAPHRWRPGHRFGPDQFEAYRRALSQVQSRLPGGPAAHVRIDLIEVLWRHAHWSPSLIHHVDLRAPLRRPHGQGPGDNSGLPT